MDLVTVSNVSLVEQGVTIIAPLSFAQRQGQRLALAGASGAGKSTLLQLVAGLAQPTTGEIRIGGARVRGPHEVLVPGHPGVAYLSQKSDLPHSLRVEQVLRYASRRPAAEAQALYELCRIAHLLGRRTDQLSGGEQQRVAMARLLLGAPRLLLLDEPFSNLDRAHKRTMQAIIEEVGTRLGITCLLVSHDATDVLPWADEILVLRRGELVQRGTPQALYYQPANEYVAALFGDYNLLRGPAAQRLAPAPLAPGAALLLRPEQVHIGPSGGEGLPGTVRAVRFMGSYYEVEIELADSVVRARTSTAAFAPGAAVAVAATQ
ncbi:MAG TPA: ABC transporter ATP-binding protein [Hymenobacter sp.]|uniref:ABC transporter ATP-binding protein n=1 Tax=Hymenobacter sp. TaxID=1898978 RepID=UPI002D80D44F|nr:ABC transporter ATP-binding protein [Hymenobacter sp.]HET9502381.1 ABC transporter ATP-binding protein [Hymenobacter sp.]